MNPPSLRRPPPIFTLLFTASLAFTPALRAQQDAPPADVGQLLQALRLLRDQQVAQIKTQKQTAMQQIGSAAASTEKGVQLWEDAVRATQFDGMAKEGAQFRAWKEGEGEALKEHAVQSAVHLHLSWLALTLQHSAGTKVKDMLPAVVNYTKELTADEAAMDVLADSIKREREAAAIAPPGGGGAGRRNQPQARKVSDNAIKRAHDQILRPGLTASPVVKWLNLAAFAKVEKWEDSPGDLDGIYQKVILPEMRAQKDSRVLEYWDLKLKKEADAASRIRLAFEIEKFNALRRPALLWGRAQEFALLDQKNRAISEMFALIKAYPTHPDAAEWIETLEQLLAPAAPATSAESAAAAAPARVPGL